MPIHRHLLAAVLFASAAAAQQPSAIAARVAAAPPDATVEMRYAARAGVCGDGRNYIAVGHSTIHQGTYNDGDDYRRGGPCVAGPVRAVMTLRGHEVSRIKTYVGGDSAAAAQRATDAPVVDLGVVDSRDAAAYVLDLARKDDLSNVDHAILAAVLADRAVVWPALLAIARDSGDGRRHGRNARGSAGFWLSRFAAAARDGRGDEIGDSDPGLGDEERDDVRGQAVFALSQLPRHEGVPSLIDVARNHKDPAVRAKALFWLGQSDDPRAWALFEEILSKRGTR